MNDVGDDVRWMPYAELGQARGISTASATRLAFRRKWRRQGGNDGIARVAVPTGEDQPRHDDRETASQKASRTSPGAWPPRAGLYFEPIKIVIWLVPLVPLARAGMPGRSDLCAMRWTFRQP